MNVEYLIQILKNKLNTLSLAKDQAFMVGDLERINLFDIEINEVSDTLKKLELLAEITQAAVNTNTTATSVVAAGVDAMLSQNNPGTSVVLGEYDLSTYATDPLYGQKLDSVMQKIGEFISAQEIDTYLQNTVSGSPLTGQMIFNATQQYGVSVRLLVAMLELESRFGTAGVGANTFNPGNVGNTGSETRTYNSWQEGVDVVAAWLSRHRSVASVETSEPVYEEPEVEIFTVDSDDSSVVIDENISSSSDSVSAEMEIASSSEVVE